MRYVIADWRKPPRGDRQRICQGDEAVVSRIFGGPYAGMVERLQLLSAPHTFKFTMSFDDYTVLELNRDWYYALAKFAAGRVAHAMYPDNFVDLRECRVFRQDRELNVASYSVFVPDENGVIARRASAMRRYYKEEDESTAMTEIALADAREAELTPHLKTTVAEIESSGMKLSHPEANYHLNEGKPVFFEVTGMDVPRMILSIRSMSDPVKRAAALAELSLLVAIVLEEKIELAGMHFSEGQTSKIRINPPIYPLMQIIYNYLQQYMHGGNVNAQELRELAVGQRSELQIGWIDAFLFIGKYERALPENADYFKQNEMRAILRLTDALSANFGCLFTGLPNTEKRTVGTTGLIPMGREALTVGENLQLARRWLFPDTHLAEKETEATLQVMRERYERMQTKRD